MQSASTLLAHRVEAFEDALTRGTAPDLAAFLPEPSHSLYPQILSELVRVDLEHGWSRDRKPRLNSYRRFPQIFENRSVLAAVTFEEYRLRRRAGERVTPDEYRTEYSVDTTLWPSLVEETPPPSEWMPPTNVVGAVGMPTDRVSPASPVEPVDVLSRWSEASQKLPEPGTNYLGFHLVEELGRGAFGRVYLARQGDLAARPVALKVAFDLADESNKLAQLQHTNIVPIYSFHRVGSLQAACMPYFGRTTLAQILLRVRGMEGSSQFGS